MSYKKIHSLCLKLKDNDKAKGAMRFFKTGKGEYAEGDLFYGINVPTSRKIAKQFFNLSLGDLQKLFASKIHEERLIGILIMNLQYQKAIEQNDSKTQVVLYKKYYSWRSGVNNWDLVDTSAPFLSGHYFFHHSNADLKKLVKSKKLWDRRIAVVSMFYFIKQNDFKTALEIVELCLFDHEDLMHKACGWVLRELGKKDKAQLVAFLNAYSKKMPRTSLRYSLEKFSEKEKSFFMAR